MRPKDIARYITEDPDVPNDLSYPDLDETEDEFGLEPDLDASDLETSPDEGLYDDSAEALGGLDDEIVQELK